jgi:PAS domain S-box-containing protein
MSGTLATAIDITAHERAETHLALQHSIARVLSDTRNLEEAAAPILKSLCERLSWDVGEISIVGTEHGMSRWDTVWAFPSMDISALKERSRTRMLPGCDDAPWQDGQPSWIADIAQEESLASSPEARHVGLHGMLRLPITVHGEVCAVLRLFCRGVRPKDEAVEEFLASIVAQIGQALEFQRSVALNRDSEARQAAIIEASLDAVMTIDREGRVVEFNAAAENVFGYRRADVLGRELSGLVVPARMREQVLAGFADYLATGERALPGKRFIAFAMKSDGSEFPIEVAMAAIRGPGRSLLTIFVCDVTARENAERMVGHSQARLQALMAELLLAEEHERRRLAVDIHDGLSQTIALTRIKLAALRKSMKGGSASSLDEIDDLMNEADMSARSISFELSPPILHDFGLEPAVRWLVENINARYGIEIVLDADAQPKPADEKTRVILFRSIREILVNAAEHARARHVHVWLEREENRLNASIEDDGVGMEPHAVPLSGAGMFSMREVLTHVGGGLHVESVPGKGTRTRLYAPLTSKSPVHARMEA